MTSTSITKKTEHQRWVMLALAVIYIGIAVFLFISRPMPAPSNNTYRHNTVAAPYSVSTLP
ncbi:MAG: hypothetical protein H0X33_15000 [Taibaiella sp.]|nr:hypothetical protein [Taibaiella sp.]